MTKQEKIQEAYGDLYESIKNRLNSDGFIAYENIDSIYDIEEREMVDRFGKIFIRPKSLQGIETNNGWTEYNLNIDLDGGYYHLIISGECRIDYFSPTSKTFEVWSKHAVTHYQPIVKPQPPIY